MLAGSLQKKFFSLRDHECCTSESHESGQNPNEARYVVLACNKTLLGDLVVNDYEQEENSL